MKKIYFLILLAFLCSCSDDPIVDPLPPPFELEPSTDLLVLDVANSGTGSDLEISFTKPDFTNNVEEYRVFVSKSENASNFNVIDALNAPAEQYIKIGPISESVQLRFPESIRDIDGDLISEDFAYNLLVLTKGVVSAISEGTLSSLSNRIQLTQQTAISNLTDISEAEDTDLNLGYLSADPFGNLYMGSLNDFATSNGTRFLKISPEGNVSTVASNMQGPAGNTFDNEGNIFVCNHSSNQITRITENETISVFAEVNGPRDIVFDGTSTFYVLESPCNLTPATISLPTGASIKKIDMDGNVSEFASGDLLRNGCPISFVIASTGDVFVATVNLFGYVILKIDPDGNESLFYTTPFGWIGDMAIHNDLIYLTLSGERNSSIYTLDLEGKLKQIAGTGPFGAQGNRNGPLTEAVFNEPRGIAVYQNKIYVNDLLPNGSGTVRVIDIVQ